MRKNWKIDFLIKFFAGLVFFVLFLSKDVFAQQNHKFRAEQIGVDFNFLNSEKPVSGEIARVTIYFKNIGTETWIKNDDTKKCSKNETCLGTAKDFDRESKFGDATSKNLSLNWISNSRPAKMNEKFVKPGSVATFTFKIKIPEKTEDSLGEYFAPVVEEVSWVEVSDSSWNPIKINLGSNFSYLIQNIKVDGEKIKNGEIFKKVGGRTVPVEIKLKNSGKEDWVKNSIFLAISSEKSFSSIFSTGSWNTPNSPTTFIEEKVSFGEVGTFKFFIRSPIVPEIYKENFRLVSKNSDIKISGDDISLFLQTEEPKFSYKIISKSSIPQKMESGEPRKMSIKIQNTGNVAWYKNDGTNPSIFLVLTGSNDKNVSGELEKNFEWGRIRRISSFKESVVLPNEIATFDFTLIAPFEGGKFLQEYAFIADYVKFLDGEKILFETEISSPIHKFEIVSQKREAGVLENDDKTDDGMIFMNVGEITDWWIKVKNTGNYTWRHYENSNFQNSSENGNIRLVLYCSKFDISTVCEKNSKDRRSVFYVPGNWISETRLATFSEEIVPPGAIATFEFKIKAPTFQIQKKEYVRLINEKVSYMEDVGIYFEPVVVSKNFSVSLKHYETTQSLFSNGKNIRIPLSKTKVGIEQHLPINDYEVLSLVEASNLYNEYKFYQNSGSIEKAEQKREEWKKKLAEIEGSHYSRSGTSSAAKNGFASSNWGGVGRGAFFPPTNSDYEKYYITMRWPYVSWKWNGETEISDPVAFSSMLQYKGKKILVTNIKNGKSVVVSILESGPAPWTGTCYDRDGNLRNFCESQTNEKFGDIKDFGIDSSEKVVQGDEIPLIDSNNDGREDINVGTAKAMRGAGLSPEAFEAIGASIDDIIEVGFLVDQSLPLGPVL